MRRGFALRLAAVSGYAAIAVTACGGSESPPTSLLDGSPAVAPPVVLEGVDGPAIEADVVVIPRRRVTPASAEAACLRGAEDADLGPLVVRVGTYARSVTFRAAARRALIACETASPGREGGGSWCGRAFGLLRGGRLQDPRLDLACTGADGRPIAFAWVEPSPRATYVAVEERGYLEVYTPAGGLPVRVVTTDVEIPDSSASFAVSEHDRSGHLLRRYRLEATVAG